MKQTITSTVWRGAAVAALLWGATCGAAAQDTCGYEFTVSGDHSGTSMGRAALLTIISDESFMVGTHPAAPSTGDWILVSPLVGQPQPLVEGSMIGFVIQGRIGGWDFNNVSHSRTEGGLHPPLYDRASMRIDEIDRSHGTAAAGRLNAPIYFMETVQVGSESTTRVAGDGTINFCFAAAQTNSRACAEAVLGRVRFTGCEREEEEVFQVVSVSPPPGTESVDVRRAEIEVMFSEPVDLGDAGPHGWNIFRLEYPNQHGEWVTDAGSLQRSGPASFTYTPTDALMPGVIYRARVIGGDAGVRSRDRARLDRDYYTWQFSTAVEPETVEVNVFQVVRNAPLVPDKPTLTRVYVYWSERPDVLPSAQVRGFPAIISVEDHVGNRIYPEQRVRVLRPDQYSREDIRQARNSVNFFNWRPPTAAPSPSVRAVVEIEGMYPSPLPRSHATPGSRSVTYWRDGPGVLTFDYYFLRDGDWGDGVPERVRQSGIRMARDAEVFTTQNFPVRSTRGRGRGDFETSVREAWNIRTGASLSIDTLSLMRLFHDRVGPTSSAHINVLFMPVTVAGGAQAWSSRTRVSTFYPIVRSSIPEPYYVISALTHEFGHIFGLQHLPSADLDEERAEVCRNYTFHQEGVEGFRLALSGRQGWNKSAREGNQENRDRLLALMFPCIRQTDGTGLGEQHYWMHSDQYRQLMQGMERHFAARVGLFDEHPERGSATLQPTLLMASRTIGAGPHGGGDEWTVPQHAPVRNAVLVSGIIDVERDEVMWLPLHAVRHAFPTSDSPGPYAISLYDASGRLLAQSTFGLTANEDDATTNRYFSFAAEVDGDVSRVELLREGRTISEARREGGAPRVELLSPVDGAALGDVEVIRWNASHPSDLPLWYAVHYSATGEFPWSVLATDYAATELDVNPLYLEPGPSPTIRVIASDGFDAVETFRQLRPEIDPAPIITYPADVDVVGVMTDITASFLTTFDASQFGATTFVLRTADGTAVPATVSYDEGSHTAILTPTAALDPGTSYTALLRAGIEDRYGNRLERDYVWRFSTTSETAVPDP